MNTAAVVDAALEPRVLLSGTNELAVDSTPDSGESESPAAGSVGDRDFSVADAHEYAVADPAFNNNTSTSNISSEHSNAAQDRFFSDAQADWQSDGSTGVGEASHHQNGDGAALPDTPSNSHLTAGSLAPPTDLSLTTEQMASSATANGPADSGEAPSDESDSSETKTGSSINTSLSESARQQPAARNRVQIRPRARIAATHFSATAVTLPSDDLQQRQTAASHRGGNPPAWQPIAASPQSLAVPGSSEAFNDGIGRDIQAWQLPTAAAELRCLLSSFVLFDTAETLTIEVSALTDWLPEQLKSIDITRAAEPSVEVPANSVYAEQHIPQADGDSDNRQIRHAWSRIDTGRTAESVQIMLTDNPPEPVEIFGIWQQIKFDCNPRGPPRSDGLPASEFTRPTGSAIQLQQLRHSIAPRGPSAASVN